MVDEVTAQLSRRFDSMYASAGRPSIPPEKLLRAQLLQMLYSIRGERLLMEEIDYSLLFRWFVGLNMDEEVWGRDHVYQEPGSVAGGRGGERVPGASSSAGTDQRPDLGRALHGGWDVAAMAACPRTSQSSVLTACRLCPGSRPVEERAGHGSRTSSDSLLTLTVSS